MDYIWAGPGYALFALLFWGMYRVYRWFDRRAKRKYGNPRPLRKRKKLR